MRGTFAASKKDKTVSNKSKIQQDIARNSELVKLARGSPPSDDYCEACKKAVANHETDHGLLCDKCYKFIYGQDQNWVSLNKQLRKYRKHTV